MSDPQNTKPAVPGSGVVPADDPSEDIRDIRGPKAVPGAFPLPLLILAAILLALAAFALWFWRRRAQHVRALSLTEQTLERLEAIRPLMQPASAREFGIAASEIVRTYVERRFDVIATQRTTEEFLQSLVQDSQTALAGYRPLLGDFLQQCDFVKFAGGSLTSPDMESLFASARKFVMETGQPAAA
jgi:HAMP domain-containing protein